MLMIINGCVIRIGDIYPVRTVVRVIMDYNVLSDHIRMNIICMTYIKGPVIVVSVIHGACFSTESAVVICLSICHSYFLSCVASPCRVKEIPRIGLSRTTNPGPQPTRLAVSSGALLPGRRPSLVTSALICIHSLFKFFPVFIRICSLLKAVY